MQKLLLALSFLMGGSLALSSSKISSKFTPLDEAGQDLTTYALTQAQKVDHAMSVQRGEFGAQIVDAIPPVAFEAIQSGFDSVELEDRDRPTTSEQPALATEEDQMWAKVLERRAAAGVGIHEEPLKSVIPVKPAINQPCRGCDPFSAWDLNTFQVDKPAEEKEDTKKETKEDTGIEQAEATDTQGVTPY